MELYVYSRDMTLQGIVEKISSLIWTRRYWSCGEFKLLVPFTEEHACLLVKENIIIKRGGNEAAEIRYIHITKNSQGMEEIEVQGKFLLSWIGKRILTTQIITKDTTQNILYAIVKQTCTNAGAARNIPNFSISTTDADTGSGQIDYTSEQYANAQLAAETAAKAAKLGIRVLTNARTGKHTFSVYEGRDLTAGNTAGNAPCIFSQEFDNIVEQEYTNSVENLKTTAYVGGEEKEGVTRKVAEVGGSSTGLSRDEVFINATDIVQEYENESGQTVTLTTAQYLALLSARGVEELEQYAETLAFGSKINTNANLKYGTDYDLGDRVTCINTMSPYNTFEVYEPKRRVVMSNSYKDKVVQHSLCDNVLEPILTRSFIRDNYASQVGKGTHYGLDRLQEFMRRFYRKNGIDGWILKGDISKYFYSIRHDVLKTLIREKITDPDVLWLVDLIIDSTEGNVGIPIGNQTSQLFALLYLDGLDHFVKEKLGIKYYGRYMDDFFLIHHDKAYLQECRKQIEAFVQARGLSLNAKTNIFPLKHGVDFLGFHTYLTESGAVIRKVRRRSKNNMKRKLKKLAALHAAGRIDAKTVEQSYQSWRGHAEKGNSYHLIRRTDQYYNSLMKSKEAAQCQKH